jgi:putative drug exporter of the RND superfamily
VCRDVPQPAGLYGKPRERVPRDAGHTGPYRDIRANMEQTWRVITAASMIMILVFASFIIGGQMPIQQIGLGFAAAIFVDAYLIRTVLVPATMHLLGRANWWLPAWLDRVLPRLHVEPAELTQAAPPRQPTHAGPHRP